MKYYKVPESVFANICKVVEKIPAGGGGAELMMALKQIAKSPQKDDQKDPYAADTGQ